MVVSKLEMHFQSTVQAAPEVLADRPMKWAYFFSTSVRFTKACIELHGALATLKRVILMVNLLAVQANYRAVFADNM